MSVQWGPASVSAGEFEIVFQAGKPPRWDDVVAGAELVDRHPRYDDRAGSAFLAVSSGGSAPRLAVEFEFVPAGDGFSAGAHCAPDSGVVFLAGGTSVLAYRLDDLGTRRLWTDDLDSGFWNWRQYGEVVLLSAERQFTAWTSKGQKLWSREVEAPWSYRVGGRRVWLGVMGSISEFDVYSGPAG